MEAAMEHLNLPSQIGLSRQEIIDLCQGNVTPEKLADIITTNNEKIYSLLQLQLESINNSLGNLELRNN
jgi:hypothetical protein